MMIRKMYMMLYGACGVSVFMFIAQARSQDAPPANRIVVIDTYASGPERTVAVEINGSLQWGRLIAPPRDVAPPPPPVPADPDMPSLKGEPGVAEPVRPPSDLGLVAQKYLYWIPEFHRQAAEAVKTDTTIVTVKDLQMRATQLRDTVGNPFGQYVNAALKASGGHDDYGRITDRDRISAIFMQIYQSQIDVMKPKPSYLTK